VLRLHVAADNQHRVGRAVVRTEPLAHVVERRRVQVLHGADDGPRIRMPLRVHERREPVPDAAIRTVLPLPLLVLDDAALLIELRLVDCAEQVPHPIRLEPERAVERALRNGLEVVRAIVVRRAVDAGRTHLRRLAEPVGVRVFAAVEHQVLEQMREARATRALVLRADVVPDVHTDDRRLVVLVHDHGQTVAQHALGVRDLRQVRVRRGGRCGRRAESDGRERDERGGVTKSGTCHGGVALLNSNEPRRVAPESAARETRGLSHLRHHAATA